MVSLLVGCLSLLGLNSCVSKKEALRQQQQLQSVIDEKEAEIDALRSALADRDAQIQELRKREDMGRQRLLYGGPNREFRKIEE